MMLSILPMTTMASDFITKVDLNIEKPVAGEPLRWHKTATTVNMDSNYKVYQNAEWYDETEKRYLKQTENFQSGHVYTVEIWVEAKDGYEFDATATAYNLKATVNGKEAKVSKAFEYQRWAMAVVSYTFPEVKEHKEITHVNVSDIIEPKIGRQSIARPHYLKYSEGVEGYDATWYENYQSTGANLVLPFTGVFAEKNTYTFEVVLEAKDGYAFARKSTGLPDVVVTFNGTAVGYSIRFDGAGRLAVLEEYDYLGAAKEKIMGAVSYKIQEPVIGEKPSFKAENQREDGLYYIDTVDPNSTKNGIIWYEGVGGARKMDENDTFKSGEYYYVAIKVKPIDGYQFDTDSNGDLLVRGAINGNMSIIGGNEEGLFIGYTFPLLEETKKQPQAPETTIENKFVDVKPEDWFYNDVMSAVQLGLINGKTDTEYKPYDNLTYAEAIKLAACMHQLYTDGAVTLKNGTVNWYDTYVAYCVDNGIIDKDYNYDDYATRSGYMVIFANALPDEALEKINNVPDGSIPDVPMTRAYSKAVYKLYRAGILQGSDDAHNCKPLENIRRSEVAAILSRMMDKTKRVKFSMDA